MCMGVSCVQMCHAEVIGGCWVSHNIILHLILTKQGFPLNLELD